MSVKANQEQSSGFEKRLWQGNALVNVIAVNPTMEELHALGIMVKQEPNYKNDNFGKITLWVENITTGHFPISFLVNAPKESSTGKFQYIDKYGKTQWAKTPTDLTATFIYDGKTFPNMDLASARKAYGGEGDLVNFVANWADVQKDRATKLPSECSLDTMDALLKSDASEIKALFKSLPIERKVWICLGVRDGQYQDFYTRAFDRGWAKEAKNIIKAIGKEDSLKSDFGASPYALVEYLATNAPVVAKEMVSNDLPF